MSDEFIIYRVCPVVVKQKKTVYHKRVHPKRLQRRFHLDYGDLPEVRLNDITGYFEEVVNTRGNAYAVRNRLKYKRNKRYANT